MAAKKGPCSAAGLEDLDPDYDHLGFAYFDDAEEEDHHPKKPGKNGKASARKEPQEPSDPPYILGTLIVRVVAARDLQPARNANNGGLGDFLFGGKGGGSANPYASVKFGTSTQRTSDLYDTLDPLWPRGEEMFMDVSLPLSKTTHPDPTMPPSVLTNVAVTPGVVWNESDSSEGADRCGDDPGPIPDIRPMDSHASSLSSSAHSNQNNHSDSVESLDNPEPILSIAVFSSSEVGKAHKSIHGSNEKYPKKKGFSGDSDDEFLGMASVDLTTLLTGKRTLADAWLPLNGGTGSIRIACEYETTDTPPEKGDLVRFTRFCHPADLYPLVPGRIYPVEDVVDKDHVLLSYISPEGWICSFMVHRFMVLCVERHHGAVEACREEWQSLTERLSNSPIVGTVTQTVERLPEEGLISVGATAISGGAHLLGRWLEGGLDTAVKDVAFATNWDGRFNPGLDARRPAEGDEDDNNNEGDLPDVAGEETIEAQSSEEEEPPIILPDPAPKSGNEKEALPGMPSCPITGEPMIDPVVAADGHTYERFAIARWLQTSDKSPLTGSVLHHKELVPNYGLLSSLQEQADANRKKAPAVAAAKTAPKVARIPPEEDSKAAAKPVEPKSAPASSEPATVVTAGTQEEVAVDGERTADAAEKEVSNEHAADAEADSDDGSKAEAAVEEESDADGDENAEAASSKPAPIEG